MQTNGLNIEAHAYKNLESTPHLYKIVAAFGKHFRTSFAWTNKDDKRYSYIFLSPESRISKQFNLNREILCVVPDHERLDSRVFKLIKELLDQYATRLERDSVFIVASANNAQALAKQYMEESGIKVICCEWRDIEAAHEEWPYELLRQFLYSRDFFDVSDPVSSDKDFFARYRLVDDIHDTLADGQSVGVFGLRKIGKTSVLERLKVKNALTKRFRIAHIDAQGPEIYNSNAAEVVLEICRAFARVWRQEHHRAYEHQIPSGLDIVEASRFFRKFVQRLEGSANKPLLLIIDELERILPHSARMSHWNADYLHFWRLLRSESQTMHGRFMFLVASTNPYFVEAAQFDGEDNPLYRFIRPVFVPMFSHADLEVMLGDLGKPMGVFLDDAAIETILVEYGGHPFLSRQLCSFISKELPERELHITGNKVQKSLPQFRAYSRSDMDAILKVFGDFYPDELKIADFAGTRSQGGDATFGEAAER